MHDSADDFPANVRLYTSLNLTITLIMSTITRKNRFMSGIYLSIRVSGKLFSLSEEQIFSEPESIFVEPLREGVGTVRLNADEGIFRLISTHLKGYDIFPLPEQGIPYLSKEATLKALLRDATDFGLTNLVVKIEREMANQVEAFDNTREKPIDEDHEADTGFVMLDSAWRGD
jgi:hypothetical protein